MYNYAKHTKRGDNMVRAMTIDDYDAVSGLWNILHGFAIRSIDDSREGISIFLKRNPIL